MPLSSLPAYSVLFLPHFTSFFSPDSHWHGGAQGHFPLPTPISYAAGCLVHFHFCSAGKTNFPLEFVFLFVCLKSNIARDQPVSSIPASPGSSERSGLPGQWDFKITPQAKHTKSVQTGLPQRPVPAQPPVLGSSPGLHRFWGYWFRPQLTDCRAGSHPVIKSPTIAAFLRTNGMIELPSSVPWVPCSMCYRWVGSSVTIFCSHCTIPQALIADFSHCWNVPNDSSWPGRVCLETCPASLGSPFFVIGSPSVSPVGGTRRGFLTSSQGTIRIPLGSEVLGQEHGFQLLAVYIRIIAGKPQENGHIFIQHILIRYLLYTRYSARAWVYKDE